MNTTTATIADKITSYVALNGPTTPARMARDLGLPEAALIEAATKWEQRSPMEGPGQNYIVG